MRRRSIRCSSRDSLHSNPVEDALQHLLHHLSPLVLQDVARELPFRPLRHRQAVEQRERPQLLPHPPALELLRRVRYARGAVRQQRQTIAVHPDLVPSLQSLPRGGDHRQSCVQRMLDQ